MSCVRALDSVWCRLLRDMHCDCTRGMGMHVRVYACGETCVVVFVGAVAHVGVFVSAVALHCVSSQC